MGDRQRRRRRGAVDPDVPGLEPGFTVHLNAPGGEPLPRKLLAEGVIEALSEGGAERAEISVTFLGDGPIRELNRRYLSHDWVPDVLAFPLHDREEPLLGDVYVGVEQARRQAHDAGVPLAEELVRLAVHGTLHLLGYEHPDGSDEERARSEHLRVQERIVEKVTGGEGGAASAVPGPPGEGGT